MIIICFQARNKIGSQANDNGLFDRLPTSYAVSEIGSEKHPDNGINCDYDRDNYFQAYYEIENIFEQQTLTNFLQPLIDLHLLRNRYNFHVSDLSKQKKINCSTN